MTQGDFGFPDSVAALEWRRYPGLCRAEYQMIVNGEPNGVWIRACGHPTALRPYYVVRPDGTILDRKFPRVEEAKAAVTLMLQDLAG